MSAPTMQPDPNAPVTLVVTEKGGAQRQMAFAKSEVTIGRVQGNDIILPKGNVSKRHARIVRKDGRFIVVDLKSTNGTYVNGRKITSPLVVRDGDKVYIGDFIVTVAAIPRPAPVPKNEPPPVVPPPLPSPVEPPVVPVAPPSNLTQSAERATEGVETVPPPPPAQDALVEPPAVQSGTLGFWDLAALNAIRAGQSAADAAALADEITRLRAQRQGA